MRTGLRTLARGTGLALATTLLCLPFAALGGLARVAPARLARAAHRARRRLVRLWGRAGLALLGVELHVVGAAPEPPFLLVANHVSYLDVLVIAAVAPAVFVAKREVAAWPAVGALARLAGTVFVDRERRGGVEPARRSLAAELAAGRPAVLFPEGTSSDGRAVLPFRSSLLQPALDTGAPLVCAGIAYELPPPVGVRPAAEAPAAEEAVAWWGAASFGPHLRRLLGLPAIVARVALDASPLEHEDRKALAREAHARVARLVADLRTAERRGRLAARAGARTSGPVVSPDREPARRPGAAARELPGERPRTPVRAAWGTGVPPRRLARRPGSPHPEGHARGAPATAVGRP